MHRLALVALVACGAAPRTPVPLPKPGTAPSSLPFEVPAGARLPTGVRPIAYDVRLDVDPDREAFSGHVAIRVHLDAPADHVWLHALDLEIASARFAAGPLAGPATLGSTVAAGGLRSVAFGAVVPAGEVALDFDYTGHAGSAAEGLFREQTGGRWYLFAQSEAMFARRIVPCFDEPAFKAAWRVTLVVPDAQVALANGAMAGERVVGGGKREVRFSEVAAMPSYLLSIAVGPFDVVAAGGVGEKRVPLRIAVARGDAARTAVAADKTARAVEALERYLGTPLPLAKLDLVAVPELFGAMENVGLVTFDAAALVGDASDAMFVRRYIRFIAHELAHQWFGNSVTPAWWDDLWLSEGLATWLGDRITAELGGLDDAVLRTQLARDRALAADGEPGARPLHRAIASTDDVDQRFDAISYEKGSAVLAMLEHFAGEPAWQAAVRAYLRERAGGVATSHDFAGALAGVHLDRALLDYLDRTGAPVLEVEARCGDAPRVELHARAGASIPACVRTPEGEACALVGDHASIPLHRCPAWVVGNAGGRGYYRTVAAGDPPRTPAEKLAHAADVAGAIAAGEVTARAAVGEIATLAGSKDVYDRLAALSIAAAIDPLVGDGARAAWSAFLAARYRDRTTAIAVFGGGTPVELELRDRLIDLLPGDRFDRSVFPAARAVVDRVLAGDHPPTESFARALAITASRASPDDVRRLFERVVDAAASSSADLDRQTALLETLGVFGADFSARVVGLVGDARWTPARAWPAVSAMLARPATRAAAWRAVREHLAELLAKMAPTDAHQLIDGAAQLCERGDVAATFQPRLADIPAGAAHLATTLAAIDRCIARRAAVGDVGAALP